MATRGSFQNLMLAKSINHPDPEVGMGVTKVMWTDRVPYKVIEVINDKLILVQELVVTDEYPTGYGKITDELKGSPVKLSKRKNGRWSVYGQETDDSWVIGHASHYYDVHF